MEKLKSTVQNKVSVDTKEAFVSILKGKPIWLY